MKFFVARNLAILAAGWGIFCHSAMPRLAAEEMAPVKVLDDFDQPFLFSYLSWQDKAVTRDGVAILRGFDNRGGAGINVQWDLAADGDLLPAIRVKVGAENQAAALVVSLRDGKDGSARWEFPLGEVAVGADEFVTILPSEGASLSDPNSVEKSGMPDLSDIRQLQLMGDWVGPKKVDVEVTALWLVKPTPALLAARADREKKRQAKAEAQNRERENLIARYRNRTEHSPTVEHLSAVAPDVIAIEIQAGRVVPGGLVRYVPQPEDTMKEKKKADGEIELVLLERDGKKLGWLVGPNREWLTLWESIVGDPLLEFLGDEAANFQVVSEDDPGFASAATPVSIFRKIRANGWAQGPEQVALRHTYYLKLAKPLTVGKTYTVALGGLNTRDAKVTWMFDPGTVRSEAVHVHQIGYRPDDPVKRAFVSCWLGNGGRMELPGSLDFSLVDDAIGKVAFTGKAEVHFPATKDEEMARTANFNGTDVARCDFSAFQLPGRYRVVVAGVGCSYPFEIGRETWRKAFLTQMRGLFHQRSGVELGPPHTDFKKPRDMHPADGYPVTRTRYRAVEKGETAYAEYAAGDTGEPVPQAAGGYHDAGDWNPRRVTHMRSTMAMLEVLDLFPESVAALKLDIPPIKGIPDILTEALFEFSFFEGLQQEDGGVGSTVESKGDPLVGEVSWLNSFPSYVTAGDYAGSWYYAAVGARLSRLLAPYDAKRAAGIRESAIRAFEFAEKDHARDRAEGLTAKRPEEWRHLDFRNLAALELYRLTKEPAYHNAFLEDSVLTAEQPEVYAYGKHIQREHAFLYARLPGDLGDPALKTKAEAGVRGMAERALEYAEKNAFNLTTPDRLKPQFIGFYTCPDASDLVHAHVLTGDKRYLAGVVQSTQFQSGCNPNNWVYITGLGANPVKHAFKLDARRTGQPVPAGLVPYGNVDFTKWNHQGITWPITWVIGKSMVPNAYSWPTTEAYWDLGGWPMLEEFTVDAWADNILVWGYLAERP